MGYLGNEPADVAVTVGQGVIDASHIQDSSITTADLGNDAVTPNKIDDDGTGFQMGSLGLGTAVSGSHKLTVGGTATFSGDITGTLATASQGNITSVGTLTTLTVDNITLNSSDINNSTGNFTFSNGGSEKLRITSDKVMFSADAKVDAGNTRDLGTTGTRWKDLYLQGTANASYVNINGSIGSHRLVVDNGTTSLNRGNSSGDILDVRGLNASQFKVTTSGSTFGNHVTIDGVGHPVLKLVGDASAGESTHLQLHRSNGHGFTIYDTGAALAFRSDTSSNDQMLQLANSDQSATFYGDVTISKSSAKMTIFASNTGDHESLVFDRNTASNGDSQEIRWKLQGNSYPGGYILHEFADANNSTMAFGTRNSGTPTTAMSIDQNTRVSLAKLPYRVNTIQQNQTNLMACFHWDHPDTDSTSTFDFNPVLDLGLPQAGGSFFLKISGWMLDRFFGLVTYRNNGGTGDIASGADSLDTIVNNGFSVSISRPSGNLIRIQLSGHHSNPHGWDMMAFTAPFVT